MAKLPPVLRPRPPVRPRPLVTRFSKPIGPLGLALPRLRLLPGGPGGSRGSALRLGGHATPLDQSKTFPFRLPVHGSANRDGPYHPGNTYRRKRMARLIRLDGTGHTTLAEWTEVDDAAFAAAVAEFRSQTELRLYRHSAGERRQGHPRARAAARSRSRDHAEADRRRLADEHRPSVSHVLARARVGPLAPAHRPGMAAALGADLAGLDAPLHGPLPGCGRGDAVARADRRPGRPRGDRARLDHPGALCLSGCERGAPEGTAKRGGGGGGPGPARRPARPRRT